MALTSAVGAENHLTPMQRGQDDLRATSLVGRRRVSFA